MKLTRAIHFDESDQRVFHSHTQTGEWCISGGFDFLIGVKPISMGKPDKLFQTAGLVCQPWGGLHLLP